MKKSKLFSLNYKDFFKGLIVAIITSIITFLTTELQADSHIDLELIKKVGLAAIIAFFSYILKNLFTNSQDKFAQTEPLKQP
jgi:hypothetical protein